MDIKHYIEQPKDILITLMLKTAFLWRDKLYLQIMYRLRTGKKLNLKNPRSFGEKLQWLKLYNRDPEYTRMVDKIEVKKWVSDKLGSKYIIPTIGVWNKVDDIDFNNLPNEFVLKTNHDSGGIIICKDKSKLDLVKIKAELSKSLRHNYYLTGREWPYKDVSRLIFAEKFLKIPDQSDLTDYKIYCFNGSPHYIQVIQDRNSKETIDFFDTNWNHQAFVGLNPKCSNAITIPSKPSNLKEMLNVSKILAKDLNFVRVDLYNIEGKIYFGEMTFYPASGFGKFTPEEWSNIFGRMIQLPNKKGEYR